PIGFALQGRNPPQSPAKPATGTRRISMLRPTLLSLATLALLSLPAAADGDPLADLIGTSWQLTELGGAASAADVTSTLMFSADSVNGNGGCNSYGGKLEPTPNGIAISQTFSTMM